MFDMLLSGLCQGFIWAILSLGVYISYRMLDFADLSCEGTITTGASVAAMLIWRGCNPFLAALLAFIAGCLAGTITGLLHTKLKIPPILAGILTMISLYSINIHIMNLATGKEGTSNLSLLNYKDQTVYAAIDRLLGIGKTNASLLLGLVIAAAVIALLYWFFGTEIGCAIRATGTNEKMCRAQGINTDVTKIIGLAASNGFIALSGALLSQYQSYTDVGMGVGSIVIGLASIIIGETLFARAKHFAVRLLGIVVGAVLYRIVVAFVIFSGMPSTDLKLMTAVVVAVALSLPILKNRLALNAKKKNAKKAG
ncbi:MAG: ABC transporter permease [Clostridia bacterium]|nr:ABC transporter permease [Clostridia bacterium]